MTRAGEAMAGPRRVGRRAGPLKPGELPTRENILRVAIPEFAQKGFDAVSIRQISTLAGISLPTLYFHFGDKRKLYYECCKQVFAEADVGPRDALTSAASAPERIRDFVVALAGSLIDHPHLAKLFNRELLDAGSDVLPHLLEELTMPSVSLLLATLEEATGRRVGLIEPIMLYGLVTGMVQFANFGGAIEQVLDGLFINRAQLATEVVERLFPDIAAQLRPPKAA